MKKYHINNWIGVQLSWNYCVDGLLDADLLAQKQLLQKL